MREIEGKPNGKGLRFAIVASRFNSEITEPLIGGAKRALAEAGTDVEKDVTLIRVPGAVEIPLAAQRAAVTKRFDAIVAIGCVIRGETAHAEYVSQVASNGVGRVMLDTGIPVSFGVLTVDTDAQAEARSRADHANKGFEAAMAAIEMVNLLKQI
jgi:6,7-dimethyl-8-ribityllumazine synthase